MKHWTTYPLTTHPYNPELVAGRSLARFAQTAEAAGFDGIAFTDHPAPSDKWLNAGGHDALDPFAALPYVEATLQCIDPSSVLWECSSCYGNALITKNASDFEGEVQQLGFLPFEEASANKTVANFVKYIKQVGGTPDQFSAYSYAAVLAFANAVNAIVKSDGVNGLTRENLITAMKGLTDFDAGGFLGTRSFADGKITRCFMVVKFVSGKWVRQYPTKKGTFDCKASNATQVKANLITQ